MYMYVYIYILFIIQRRWSDIRNKKKRGATLNAACQSFVSPDLGGQPPASHHVGPGSFHQCPMLIFICLLLLPDRRTGEAWKRSKKQWSFGNQGTLDRNVHSFTPSVHSCFDSPECKKCKRAYTTHRRIYIHQLLDTCIHTRKCIGYTTLHTHVATHTRTHIYVNIYIYIYTHTRLHMYSRD